MSVPERRAMVERPGENLSVRRQCALLNLARSGVYRSGPATSTDDLALMRRIDELHLKWPFYGSRRMVFELNRNGLSQRPSPSSHFDFVSTMVGPPKADHP